MVPFKALLGLCLNDNRLIFRDTWGIPSAMGVKPLFETVERIAIR